MNHIFPIHSLTKTQRIELSMRYIRCPICGHMFNDTDTKRVIDHDHKTNRIRGVICTKCNLALGLLEDKPNRIERLLRYINENNPYQLINKSHEMIVNEFIGYGGDKRYIGHCAKCRWETKPKNSIMNVKVSFINAHKES